VASSPWSLLGLFDVRADENASYTYAERTYLNDNAVGSPTVVEDARLWMPRDAAYRVVIGPRPRTSEWQSAHFRLLGLLFPRRQTDSKAARWVLCYGCDPTTHGRGFRVLSDGNNGVLFMQRR
jgi:hypothetical protein